MYGNSHWMMCVMNICFYSQMATNYISLYVWFVVQECLMICGYVRKVILDKTEEASFLIQDKYGYFCPRWHKTLCVCMCACAHVHVRMYVCMYCIFNLGQCWKLHRLWCTLAWLAGWRRVPEWLIYMKTSSCTASGSPVIGHRWHLHAPYCQ